jgi:capsular exopolysaccharide synthesis family protein
MVPAAGPPGRLKPERHIDLAQTLRTLWRRRILIAVCLVLVTGVTWAYTTRLPRIYTATTTVMLNTRQPRVIDLKEVMGQAAPVFITITSEVEVIRSRTVAERVVDDLKLMEDPELNPSLRPQQTGSDLFRSLSALWAGLKSAISGGPAEKPVDEAERQRSIRSAVVGAVLGGMDVSVVPQSLVIRISFKSIDPAKAARIANAIADAYLVEQLETKFEAVRRATTWLNGRLEALRQAVEASERQVVAYRSQVGLVEERGKPVEMQKLTDMNTQLVQIKAKRTELEAKLGRIEALSKTPGGIGNLADEFVDSPLIQHLKQFEAQLSREESDLASRYAERHPLMLKVKAELAETRSKLRSETDSQIQALRGELAVMRERDNALSSQIREAEKSTIRQGSDEIRLRELEREAQANRAIYEAFLSRFKETGEQEQIQQADVRIISAAEVPKAPSAPRVSLLVGAAALLSLLGAVVLVMLLEQLDNTFRSREQLEEGTGLPSLGLIPAIRSIKGRRSVEAYMSENPSSSFAEAFRIVWFGLKHGLPDVQPGERPNSVLITSSVPEEGKSLTALSLARTASNLSLRTILVDTDLRRASIAHTLGVKPEHGVADVLAGRATLDQAIIKDPRSKLDMLLGPPIKADQYRFDLLSGENVNNLMESLRGKYDLVIIDGPPTLPVADVQLLAQFVDRVVFCVRWDKTPKENVQSALRMLQDVKAPICGLLLTRVNLRRHARYGYGDLGHYYGSYHGYYTD